mmetsp:Transcript_12411/g.27538  ORF Transcript_12411/g.27538 Transcript_12411/m.27538 type:complete len:818 (+) Transcript_12411:58-2511(+)
MSTEARRELDRAEYLRGTVHVGYPPIPCRLGQAADTLGAYITASTAIMPPSSSSSCSSARVVAHFDLDAFYVGCERELNPTALLGVPVAISQYNPYGSLRETASAEVDERLIVRPGKPVDGDTNGSLIAVSYEARAHGVKRNDRGREAAGKCPDLRIVQVPVKHGKADLTMYRDASYRVLNKLVDSIKENTLTKAGAAKIRVEKASIDEIYIDLTSAADEMAERVVEERDRLSSACGKKRFIKSTAAEESEKDCDGVEGQAEKQKTSSISTDGSSYWHKILYSLGASSCTTIGGVEETNAAALAANALSKDELRRGSRAQVLDSSSTSVDSSSEAWWRRCLSGWTDLEIRLACGAALAAKARSDVAKHFAAKGENDTEGEIFTLSAGISTNKTLSKLASGMKKPNRQTLINPDDDALQKLFHPLPIGRIRGLGGKFGVEVADKLGVSTVGDIAKLPLADIERHYPPSPDDGTAQFLFNISRGICTDTVDDRTLAKSISCGKTFRNHLALDPTDEEEIQKWAGELCSELTERLAVDRRQNMRTNKLFGVHVHMSDRSVSASKSTSAPSSYEKYTETTTKLIRQIVGSSRANILGLTVFVSSFVEIADESSSIMAAFGRAPKTAKTTTSKHGSGSGRTVFRKKKGSLKTLWAQSENVDKSNETGGEVEAEKLGKEVAISTDTDIDAANDDEEIDPEVLSQLPPSIQEEIRLSRGAFKNEGGMNSWLSQAKRCKGAGDTDATVKRSTNAREKKESETFELPTAQDIDQEMLAELPADIREAVMKDIAASASARTRSRQRLQCPGKKRKGIDSFFSPTSKK